LEYSIKTAISLLSFILISILATEVLSQSMTTTSFGFYALRPNGSMVEFGPAQQLQVADLGAFVQVSSTGEMHHALRSDGTLWRWTFNTLPIQVGSDTWITISSGSAHQLAIRSDSTLWAWGDGADGRLGNGSSTGSAEPIQIGSDKWIAIAAGGLHSLGIRRDGLLFSWGRNDLGQLGTGNITSRSVPGIVGTERWLSISAGERHSAAIRSDSTLWTWGRNSLGQLGQGTQNTRLTSPIQVGTDKYLSVETGNAHTLAITARRDVVAFGDNQYGQLGLGFESASVPSPTLAYAGPAIELSANADRSLLRTESGAVALSGTFSGQRLSRFSVLFAGVPTAPNPPSMLTFQVCQGGFRAEWTEPSNVGQTGLSGYRVKLTPSQRIKTTVGTSVQFDGLSADSTYRIDVVAMNLDGQSTPLISGNIQPGGWPIDGCTVSDAIQWLNAGSLQNFYSEMGSEPEFTLFVSQQYGLRWPAIHPFQDAQSSKGLWISASTKVVHVGPRVSGTGEFIPVSHRKVSRHVPTFVTVDGVESTQTPRNVSAVDPSLISDQMIETVVDTRLGLRMTRRIHQWANAGFDNVHLFEYVITNNAEVSQNNVTIFWLSRYAPIRQTRYVIGNATGWGINTMIDRVGDGQGPDYGALPGIRGHIAWHGHYPSFTSFDNLGAPIFSITNSSAFVESWDQTGRLAAPHFIGNMILHAPASAASTDDSPTQPFTMTEIFSDYYLLSRNSFDDSIKSAEEILMMGSGRTQRHAYRVEPSGMPGFLAPTGDPGLGTSSGWSAATGVGPYALEPGQSVRILTAEVVDGIDRQTAETTGAAFKNGVISALQKNQVLFQGLDSLIATINTVKSFSTDLSAVPRTPAPPSAFSVVRGEAMVDLSWSMSGNPTDDIIGFQLWRTGSRVDSVYHIVATLERDARSFSDLDVIPGHPYFYYIVSLSASGMTSSRYASQTYTPIIPLQPTSLESADGQPRLTRLHDAYPNPFNPITTIGFDLAASSNIRLSTYDVIGREVAVLAKGVYSAGTHRVTFDGRSLASGVYLIRLSTPNSIHIRRITLLK
jgi:hypothetical protein